MRTWTSDVPYPALDTSDGGYRLVYDPPYTVERVREYRAVTWGGARLGCGGCHGYPPTGVHPDAKACAGESHACVDEGGYGNLHAFNHGYDPIPCRSCHARTVTEVAAFTRDSLDVTTFADIPVSGLARHADGEIDVAFDAVNPVVYPRSSLPPISMDLGAARWNAETRTCTGVPCHLQQSEVAFGAPYRWESTSECNVCHRY
jgi:predicted CxxxxCH...CXXCH cytochrome family protein